MEKLEQREKEIVKKIKLGQIETWDKKVVDFEKEKTKEMKKHATLFFIYRNNTLFEKQYPIIEKYLTKMGRQVDTQIFPQGTSEKEIQEWYKKNEELLSKKAIVSDQTARIPYEIEKRVMYDLGAREVGGLDKLIDIVMRKIVFGESKDKTDDIESDKKFMITIVKNILMNPNRHPKKVLIFLSRMGDHLIKGAGVEPYSEAGEQYMVTKIKEWLIEGGIESQKIEKRKEKICSEPNSSGISCINQDVLNNVDKPNYWIITDRHTDIKPDSTSLAIALGMPLGNFYKDAKENGLINYSEEEIMDKWKEVLEKEFGD